jgi:hypothetical protein
MCVHGLTHMQESYAVCSCACSCLLVHKRRCSAHSVTIPGGRGSPMRTPPGFIALTSPTTAFLLSVMCASSQAFSILAPLMPCKHEEQRLM